MGTETLASTLEGLRKRHHELTEQIAAGRLSEAEYSEYRHLPERIKAVEEAQKAADTQPE
jgi:hypothetical protein